MRRRTTSTASSKSSQSDSIIHGGGGDNQELDTLYDYLAKIILLGPSGCGKSCILHRFVKGEWKVLSSQTIGVEFSSKIVKVGSTGVKLQLWDTAGQERFRSLTRGYYRGSAGVVLVYDITNRDSFRKLPEFMADIKALTPSTVSVVVVANKIDVEEEEEHVTDAEVTEFCQRETNIPIVNASAYNGQNIDELFDRLTSMIVTKIELGVIDPEDMDSGVQYGQVPRWDSTISKNNGGSILKLLGGSRGRSTNGMSGRLDSQAQRSNCC